MRSFVALLLSVVALAAFSAGLNESVPVQSYEQAGAPATAPTAKPTETTPATKPVSATTSTPPAANNSDLRALQAELTQVNQNSLQYQQKTDEKILLLNNQLNVVSSRLDRLQKAMILLNQELEALQKNPTAVQAILSEQSNEEQGKNWMSYWEGRFGMWGLILFMLLILLVLAFMARLVIKASKKKTSDSSDSETDDEYDYMGSEEGMPAKLNLARAYIKMEDYDSAREVLDEVIKNGTKKQQNEAEELKKKC